MAKKKELSGDQLEEVAERFRVLGEPMRLRLIAAMMDGEKSVGELVRASGGNQANVSRHLQTLRQSGVVKRRKEGLYVIYSIADPSVFALCEIVCKTFGIKGPRKAFAKAGAAA